LRPKLGAEDGAPLPLVEHLEEAALLGSGAWLGVGVEGRVKVEVGAVWVGLGLRLGLRLGPFG
jgi:hypothetical protein